MLRKSTKDYSKKLAAVSAVLGQLSLETLKASDEKTLREFFAAAQHWAQLAAVELDERYAEKHS
jgi:hypothetical protein